MSFLVDGSETYEVEVRDPRTGDKGTVTLRELTAQDAAAIQDTVRMQIGENDEVHAEMAVGTAKLLTVQRAIVRWDFPGVPPPTPTTVAQLRPAIVDQLGDAIDEHEGNVPEPPEAAPGPPTAQERELEELPPLPAETSEVRSPEEEPPTPLAPAPAPPAAA